jgi:ATP-binding cassette, subfamily B, bacterial MsbA
MKEFLKLIWQFVTRYKTYAILNVTFNMLSIVFSLFSLTMIIPFLGVLFKTSALVTSVPAFAFNMAVIKTYFYYYISQLIIAKGQAAALVFIVVLVVIMMLLKTTCWYFANYFMTPLRTGVMRDMRNQVYGKILRLPISYFSESRKGDIMSRMSGDVQEIEWSIMSSLEMTFRDPFNIIIFIVALFMMSTQLTLFVFVLLPISALAIGRIGKTLRKTGLKGQIKMGEVMSTLEESLGGLRIIKAFNAEKRAYENFHRQNEEYTRIANKMMRRRFLASPVSEFLGVLILVVIMYYGGNLILNSKSALSPDTFIAYLAIFSQVINPAKSFSQAVYNIQKGMSSMDRINNILHAEERITEKENAVAIKEFKENIEFRNVSFAYENEPVLRNINLTIQKGKTIALVGQSGSGKSTLVDLLPRFYDVSEGDIFIDGISIFDLKIRDLRGLMGNVNQESILFNDSFYNNIAFGVEHTTKEEVIAAAKVANAHEFIMATENGYDTNIGDRGGKLSGGQRQRISIARAVLKNPPIMILDEATSSLDTESEHLVQEALMNLMKNRTSVVIAHRLSTIKHADEICVLHEGEIVERGSHDELLEKGGYYKKLYELQVF